MQMQERPLFRSIQMYRLPFGCVYVVVFKVAVQKTNQNMVEDMHCNITKFLDQISIVFVSMLPLLLQMIRMRIARDGTSIALNVIQTYT